MADEFFVSAMVRSRADTRAIIFADFSGVSAMCVLARFRRAVSLSLTFCLVTSCALLWGQSRRGGGSTGAPRVVQDPGARYGLDSGATPISSTNGVTHHAEDEGKLEFRSQAILVQVPTVVTDRSGQHVAGLTKDD